MTRTAKPQSRREGPFRRPRAQRAARCPLQDAKARFSELVRRVHDEGPQHVTVYGRDEVVVIAADEFRRLRGDLTGAVLVDAMQALPYRALSLDRKRARLPVRGVVLL